MEIGSTARFTQWSGYEQIRHASDLLSVWYKHRSSIYRPSLQPHRPQYCSIELQEYQRQPNLTTSFYRPRSRQYRPLDRSTLHTTKVLFEAILTVEPSDDRTMVLGTINISWKNQTLFSWDRQQGSSKAPSVEIKNPRDPPASGPRSTQADSRADASSAVDASVPRKT